MNQNQQNTQQRDKVQQRSQQMTQEELQKTQVLNLKDVEEAARFERITSKKPAIIVATIGALSIMFGATFGVVQTLTAEPTIKDNSNSTTEKRQVLTQTDSLNCTISLLNNADGTDQIYNVVYTFKDNKLTNFVRTSSVAPTPGSIVGVNSLTGFKAALPPFLMSLTGYESVVAPSGDGVIITTTVDYSKLDLSTFPDAQQTIPYTKIEYIAGTDKASIQADALAKGYTCQ